MKQNLILGLHFQEENPNKLDSSRRNNPLGLCSSPSVTQPTKGKKGTIRTRIHPSQPVEIGSCGRMTMEDREDHAEGSGENQVNEGSGFPIVDPDTQVQMKNISPSNLPHLYSKVHEDPESFLFEFDILCRICD